MIARGAVEERFVDYVYDLGCEVRSGQRKINPSITSNLHFKRLVKWVPVFPDVDEAEKVAEFL